MSTFFSLYFSFALCLIVFVNFSCSYLHFDIFHSLPLIMPLYFSSSFLDTLTLSFLQYTSLLTYCPHHIACNPLSPPSFLSSITLLFSIYPHLFSPFFSLSFFPSHLPLNQSFSLSFYNLYISLSSSSIIIS